MNYVVKYRDSDGKWLVKGFDNDNPLDGIDDISL